jgi:hypothetical protein
VRGVPGVASALAERLTGGRYIDVDVDRAAAARFGLSVADVQAVVSTAIGGDNAGEVIQGRERYPINVRYPREIRDSLQRLRELPFVTDKGAQLLLQDGSIERPALCRQSLHTSKPRDSATTDIQLGETCANRPILLTRKQSRTARRDASLLGGIRLEHPHVRHRACASLDERAAADGAANVQLARADAPSNSVIASRSLGEPRGKNVETGR